MPEDQSNQKDKSAKELSEEESSEEMDIIKEAFGSDEPLVSSSDAFSVDLFGEQGKKEPGPEKPEAAPSAEPSSPAPAPPPGPGQEPEKEADSPDGIKIVTDDDLKQLFDSSSPGIPPGAPLAGKEPPASAPPVDQAAPAETTVADEQVDEISLDNNREGPLQEAPVPAQPETPPGPEFMETMEAKTEEVGEAGPRPEQVEELSLEEEEPVLAEGKTEAEPEAVEEISPDEIVDQLELRAEVGDMTAVAAAKKGAMLEKTAELIEVLEPATDDIMSVTELKKLFSNVNVLIEWAREMTERLDRLEEALAKSKKGES